MNYQVITDITKLQEFIMWLPELKETEQYYLCLFARSKYTKDIAGNNGIPHIKSDKAQLKRFTAIKSKLLNKIMQLECPIGAYTQKDLIVPQEALALYITINPRDLYKAAFDSMSDLANRLKTKNYLMNPHQEVMSAIQRCKGTTHYVVFDIDGKEDRDKPYRLMDYLYRRINSDAVTVLETRGGYHLIISPTKVEERYRRSWYKDLAVYPGVDQKGDIMIPVPGTYQGGFTPHFL